MRFFGAPCLVVARSFDSGFRDIRLVAAVPRTSVGTKPHATLAENLRPRMHLTLIHKQTAKTESARLVVCSERGTVTIGGQSIYIFAVVSRELTQAVDFGAEVGLNGP
jgi:hypothetical protein